MVINSPLGSLLEEVAVVCNCYHILKYDAAVGGKLCTQRLITEVIRIFHVLNFTAVDLQLYKIFKIMRVSSFVTRMGHFTFLAETLVYSQAARNKFILIIVCIYMSSSIYYYYYYTKGERSDADK